MHFRSLGKTGFCCKVKISASFAAFFADGKISLAFDTWNTTLHACIWSPRVRAHV